MAHDALDTIIIPHDDLPRGFLVFQFFQEIGVSNLINF
jgi:hypothetical protein